MKFNMKIKYSILLIVGILFLYSSMTCVLLPPFFKVNMRGQIPNIVSQEEPLLDPRVEALRWPRQFMEDKGLFNVYYDKSSLDDTEDAATSITKRQDFSASLPAYTKGIYLSNSTGNSIKKIQNFIEKAKQYDLNTFVIDVQNTMIAKEIIDMVKEAGIFPVARIVVFEGGLKKTDISSVHLQRILKLIADSAAQGFKEIQLDYIRYADLPNLLGLSLQFKYNVIDRILQKSYEQTVKHNVYLSADLFGRTTLHQDDQIGQKLELFAKYTQTIYPMLYPSHYTNDIARISNPYTTVSEGIKKARSRLKNTRIVAYIQGFSMKVALSGLSMTKYIEYQIRACKDALSDGWIIWNPRNQYQESFRAIVNLARMTRPEEIKREPPIKKDHRASQL